jgi:oxygen-dependent protoporphyrinogen oxidase
MNHIKDTVIIGAGLSGLVVGHALKQLDPHHRLMIVEKSGKCGGVIQSFQDKGFTAEWGPHGFLGQQRNKSPADNPARPE